MEYILILMGLFGVIGLLCNIDMDLESTDRLDDEGFDHSHTWDNGMLDHDSIDLLTDPLNSNWPGNIHYSEDEDYLRTDDICHDPEYSYLSCNIYYDDNLD